jgi:hypothetical protein
MSDTESEKSNSESVNSEVESEQSIVIDDDEAVDGDVLDNILSGKAIEGSTVRSKHMIIKGGAKGLSMSSDESSESDDDETWVIRDGVSKSELINHIIDWMMYADRIKKNEREDPDKRQHYKGYARRYIAEIIDRAEFTEDREYSKLIESKRFRDNIDEIHSLFERES